MSLCQCNNCLKINKCEYRESVEKIFKGMSECVGEKKPICFGWSATCFWYESKFGGGYKAGSEGTFW